MSRRTTSLNRTTGPRHAADQPAPDWEALERWAHPSLIDRVRESLVAKAVLGTVILAALIGVVIHLLLNSPDRGTVVPPAAAQAQNGEAQNGEVQNGEVQNGEAQPSTDPQAPEPGGHTTPPGGGAGTAGPGGSAETPPADPQAPLIVYVTGQVGTPGVVQLPPGARVHDALQGAGGPTAEADLAALNLARPVQDGEHIHVVKPGEEPPASAGAPPAAGSGSEQPAGSSNSSGTAHSAPGAPGTDSARININTADLTQLQELPGVGPSIGQRIIEHREANGPFRTVEDLLEVKGIGPATLDKIRERATV